MKDVQMSFRVESNLRTEFISAAEQLDRPAAQVLREFMKSFVAQVHDNIPANDAISNQERRLREQAVNFARASVGLEGFKQTQTTEERARQFINGEIELAEFTQVGHNVE